jgi:uncharacterized membrane protein YfcA
MQFLTFVYGALVGFSLGLTGGGGAIFGVPLLVYGLDVPAHAAVGISLVAVGTTALIGFIQRARHGQVEFPTGLLFAVAGMISAPAGAALARRIPEPVLLGLFALLMLIIALRMWWKAGDAARQLVILADDNAGPTCRRDPQGRLRLTSRCAALLVLVGLATGVLAGLFGVGGGFIIVPALITFSGMGMQRAIGTSLLVMTLVSVSGTLSHLDSVGDTAWPIVILFTAGSVAGLFGGSWLARRLAGAVLQRTFAAAIIAVALLVIVRTAG